LEPDALHGEVNHRDTETQTGTADLTNSLILNS